MVLTIFYHLFSLSTKNTVPRKDKTQFTAPKKGRKNEKKKRKRSYRKHRGKKRKEKYMAFRRRLKKKTEKKREPQNLHQIKAMRCVCGQTHFRRQFHLLFPDRKAKHGTTFGVERLKRRPSWPALFVGSSTLTNDEGGLWTRTSCLEATLDGVIELSV